MTTKTISGTYSAGYVLNGAFSVVDITSAGSVGGFGLVISATATVQNNGHLQATSGANGLTVGSHGGQVDNYAGAVIAGGLASIATGAGAAGHAGGAGVYLTVYGQIAANSGRITGGGGGAGVAGTIGGVGGVGGAGASFHAGGYLLNAGAGVILGGAGGAAGADQILHDPSTAAGGTGGAGVALAAYGYIYNAAMIAGGAGGQGGYDKDLAGPGGAGGAGIAFAQSGRLNVYGGTVTGGAGGMGGAAPASDGAGGAGGKGGAGVAFGGAADLFNTGVIGGGAGGAGGAADQTGIGGDGGDGVDLLAGGFIANDGAILGGGETGAYGFAGYGVLVGATSTIVNGSAGDTTATIRAGSNGAHFQTAIVDETGVQLTLTNFGTIAGAFAAVNLGSATDALIAEAGSVFGGEVLGAGLLELGAGSGTVSGIDAYGDVTVTGFLGASSTTLMQNFGTLEIAAGGSFQVASGGTIAAGRTLIADGVVTDGAGLTVAGWVTGAGSLVVDGKLTFRGKSALSVAEIVLGAKAAKVTVDANLVYAGVWNQTTGALTIDAGRTLNFTGSYEAIQGGSLTNEGKLEASGPSHLLIFTPLANGGALIANGGTITLENAASVTGSGDAVISGGKLIALGAFDQAVTFKAAGTLVLDDSQAYTGTISGFSKVGTTLLDLGDIGFVSASEATFSGTTSGGVLTVTDGTHTARINLSGNYRSSTFVCASDGLNGVIVQDPTRGAPPPGQTHALVAAMASLGAGAPAASHPKAGLVDLPTTLLAAPR
jgi:fibronectin-binding autotransporter adhesin